MKVKLVGIDENMHAELCKLFHKCKAIASLILDEPVLSEKEQNVANDISNFLCSVLICDVYSRKAPDYTGIALYDQLKMRKRMLKKSSREHQKKISVQTKKTKFSQTWKICMQTWKIY